MNSALETAGDPWSLLVVRDIVFYGKHTFGEFLASEERITTSVLAGRLATLVRAGVLAKERSTADRRKESYTLTGKGLAPNRPGRTLPAHPRHGFHGRRGVPRGAQRHRTTRPDSAG